MLNLRLSKHKPITLTTKEAKIMNKNIYKEVTEKVLQHMQDNGTDWTKPFKAMAVNGMPSNYATGNSYNGINVLLLGIAGYSSNQRGSYKQWQAKGGTVKKGSKGTMIVFYKVISKTNKTTGEESNFPLLRYSTVFNASQIDGITFPAIVPKTSLIDAISLVDDYIIKTEADIRQVPDNAYYVPSLDYIGMPDKEAFIDTEYSNATENYYATLLHELTHWTGAKHRLARTKSNMFGDKDYAFEELIAELGSAFQCASLGISSSPRIDHAKYLNNWMKALKEDDKVIMKAASQAQKAVKFIEELQAA